MSPPNKWGPVTWILFHSLVESIEDDKFSQVYRQFFNLIKNMCSVLPCPTCSQHATIYLSRLTDAHINTKERMRNMLYIFHNTINARNKKKGFFVEDLEKYKNANIVECFNNCIREFNTKGNMNQLTESFHRKARVALFRKWLVTAISARIVRPN